MQSAAARPLGAIHHWDELMLPVRCQEQSLLRLYIIIIIIIIIMRVSARFETSSPERAPLLQLAPRERTPAPSRPRVT